MHNGRILQGTSFLGSGFFDSAHDEEQNDGAHGGHYQLTDQSIGSEAQQGENPAAKNRASDPDEQVHEGAHAVTFNDFARDKSGENSDDDGPEQPHDVPPKVKFLPRSSARAANGPER